MTLAEALPVFLQAVGEGTSYVDSLTLFALEYVYLPPINRAIDMFEGWNNHGILTVGRHSPRQMFVSGALALRVFAECSPFICHRQ